MRYRYFWIGHTLLVIFFVHETHWGPVSGCSWLCSNSYYYTCCKQGTMTYTVTKIQWFGVFLNFTKYVQMSLVFQSVCKESMGGGGGGGGRKVPAPISTIEKSLDIFKAIPTKCGHFYFIFFGEQDSGKNFASRVSHVAMATTFSTPCLLKFWLFKYFSPLIAEIFKTKANY